MPSRYITEQTREQSGWQGINLQEALSQLGPRELITAQNFDLGLHGELIRRIGFSITTAAPIDVASVHMLGFFVTDTVSQLIARCGNTVYYSADGITWTAMPGGPWGNVEFGCQYITNFYMVRRDDVIVQWDGATAITIPGSPMGSFCKVFKDRLFVLNSYALGRVSSRFFFSNPFDFSSTGWPAFNYVGVSEGDGDILIGGYNIQDHFLLFKTGAMWKLYVQGSDITAWILRPFNDEVGCISRDTLAEHEGVVYFCSAKGVYYTDGNTVKIISIPITNLWDQVVVSTVTINNHSAFFWKDKYVLALEIYPIPITWNTWMNGVLTWGGLATTRWAGSGAAYVYPVYHTRNGGWTTWAPAIAPHTFVPIELNATLKGVFCGSRGTLGTVYKYGIPGLYTDGGANYQSIMQLRGDDLAQSGQWKRGKWTVIEVEVGVGANIAIVHVVNNILQAGAFYVTGAQIEALKVAGPGKFRSWSMILAMADPQPLTIVSVGVVLQIGYGERRPIHADA